MTVNNVDQKTLSDFPSVRIAIFTHDAYGLGHVRRCLNIAQALARRAPDAAILLITGSPAVDLFASLPPNADYVKIPTIVTSGSESAHPPILPVGVAELSLLRRELILQTLSTFAPDVFLVDNFPLGARLELLPALQELRKCRTRIVLGLRDIADPPNKLRTDWNREGMFGVLERYYDSILIYGVKEVLDVVEAYGFSPLIASRVRYSGYVTSEFFQIRPSEDVRRELGVNGPFLFATVGGGGDGFPLLETVLKTLMLIPSLSALVVTGAFMKPEERQQLESLARSRSGITVRGFVNDVPSYLAAADAVVAMGGYNTTAEILALRSKSILVPRHWRSGEHSNRAKSAGGDMEQLVRAQTLAKLGYVDFIHPTDLTAQTLAERITATLQSNQKEPDVRVNVSGVQFVADHLLDLARKRN